ncbi:MAG: DUF1559 domain-containing protein [Pirellulaceae bacterium]
MSNIRFADVADGLSNTLFVGERSSRGAPSTWGGVIPGADEAFACILGIADHPLNTGDAHLDGFGSLSFIHGQFSSR